MASIYRPFRLLPPLQSSLSQSLGLRACTSLQSRLLHSSPILEARKPSKAIVKPQGAPSGNTRRKKGRDTVEEEVIKIPFKAHAPTTAPARPAVKIQIPITPTNAPATTTTSTSTSTSTPTAPAQNVSLSPAPAPIPQTNVEQASHRPLLTRPLLEYQPGGVHATLRQYANANSPTLIYEATKPRAYVAWCFVASLFLGCVSAWQFNMFTSEPARESFSIASVFLITGLMWASLSCWAAFGITNTIKRILVMPSPTGKPTLRIEPMRYMYGKYPEPFEVKIGRAFSDRRFESAVAGFEATRPVRRKPGVLDSLFGPVGTIFSSNLKMCSRKTSFAQLITPENVWKVDLRDCRVHDGGKTLDLLVLPSDRRHSWIVNKLKDLIG